MNREIKFRAISKEHNFKIYFTLEDLVNPKALFSIRELVIPWLREGNKPDQYTELKDKNKIEIYDRDILKTDSGNIGEVCHSQSVCWHLFYFLRNNPNIDKTKPFDETSKIVGLWKLCGHYNLCEVIGNKTENHELLEK